MRTRRLRALLTTAVGAAILPAAARADEPPAEEVTSWDWNLFGGVHFSSDESSLGNGRASTISNSVVLGARLTQPMGEILGIEGELPIGFTTSKDERATLFLTMPRVHGLIEVNRGKAVSPIFMIGGGVPIVTSTNRGSVDTDIIGAGYVGAGSYLNIGKTLRSRFELRWSVGPALGDPLFAQELELMLSFSRRGTCVDRGTCDPPKTRHELDRDGDKVEDKDDLCPDVPEDADGFKDDDGCPELDNDGDGVLDGLDGCPDKMENNNGFGDDDGCPDDIPDEVRLLEGVIVGLNFAGDSARIAGSTDSLEPLVEVLKKYPSIKIEIIGHTDDQGDPEANQELSEARASAVREFLIGRGIGFGRLYVSGRGADDPVASNRTAAGRRSNRRVEVRLVVGEMDAKPEPPGR